MTPYYRDGGVELYLGDCREVLPGLGIHANLALCDPPYAQTSLGWDRRVQGWESALIPALAPTASLWCFGSLRSFLATASAWDAAGWKLAQDVVWEKHNGSSFHADRFRRTHELVAQFYRKACPWKDVWNNPLTTPDATAKAVRRKTRPPHLGDTHHASYTSHDGGPRLMRSVLKVPSCHGHAIHPTQKPVALLSLFVEASCPPDGIVLVPFSGGGSEIQAARLCGRRAVACELREDYCEASARRLQQQVFRLG